MMPKGLGFAALVAATAWFPSISTARQSTFVSADEALAFALSVPDDGKDHISFTMRLKKEYSWGGVGLGSKEMSGALFLVIYRSEADGVTFSPRLAYSHMEPEHYEGVKYEVLNGTGIRGDHLYFSAHCTERCQGWPSNGKTRSYINVDSPSEPLIYALGPKGSLISDSPTANLKFHSEIGILTMDMKRTQGSKEPPSLDDDSVLEGVSIIMRKTGIINWRTTVHTVCMIVSFAGTIPLGVALLRIRTWRKWHAVTETLSLNLVVLGFATGIITSGLFQKSHRINSYHQVIGILVMAMALCQWCFGYMHYQKWKKTQSRTPYGSIHVWLGRVIILLALVNSCLGFAFADNRRFIWVLALALLVAVAVYAATLYVLKWRSKRRKPQNVQARGGPQHHVPAPLPLPSPSPSAAPWRDDAHNPLNEHQYAPWSPVPSTFSLNRTTSWSNQALSPRYEPQQNNSLVEIGLLPLPPRTPTSIGSQEQPAELDGSQKPAELV